MPMQRFASPREGKKKKGPSSTQKDPIKRKKRNRKFSKKRKKAVLNRRATRVATVVAKVGTRGGEVPITDLASRSIPNKQVAK